MTLCPSALVPSLSGWEVVSTADGKRLVGLVFSVKATRPSNAGNEAAFGEALGGIESAILLLCWSGCRIWQRANI